MKIKQEVNKERITTREEQECGRDKSKEKTNVRKGQERRHDNKRMQITLDLIGLSEKVKEIAGLKD